MWARFHPVGGRVANSRPRRPVVPHSVTLGHHALQCCLEVKRTAQTLRMTAAPLSAQVPSQPLHTGFSCATFRSVSQALPPTAYKHRYFHALLRIRSIVFAEPPTAPRACTTSTIVGPRVFPFPVSLFAHGFEIGESVVADDFMHEASAQSPGRCPGPAWTVQVCAVYSGKHSRSRSSQ